MMLEERERKEAIAEIGSGRSKRAACCPASGNHIVRVAPLSADLPPHRICWTRHRTAYCGTRPLPSLRKNTNERFHSSSTSWGARWIVTLRSGSASESSSRRRLSSVHRGAAPWR